MDSYLIVGGVPNANQYHCEDSLNLALGLLFEARQVQVPKLEQMVRLRIGVHCGPVVAGIVSQQKPRFCVLGNTVNITKTICSHSSPGKALVSNAVRSLVTKVCIPPHVTLFTFRMVTKNLKSIFHFNANGYIDLPSGKMLTHFLEKNEKSSVWDIVDRDKATNDSIDGYRELHSEEGVSEWQEATAAAYRVISVSWRPSTVSIWAFQVVDALDNKKSRTRKALTRLRSVKRKFRTIQSNDSGVSVSEPNVESAVCSIS